MRRFLTLLVLALALARAEARERLPRSQAPNDCVIVAIEAQRALKAAARLRNADCWARILCVRYGDTKMGHTLTAYQRFAGDQTKVYDADFGTSTLKTTSRDPRVIAALLGQHRAQWIVRGFFLEERQ